MLQQLLVLLAVMGLATTAMAQETSSGTTTTTIDESVDSNVDLTKEGEDIDAEITNAKLRAESGSKSTWSISTSVGYNGGSIKAPFSDTRPDYRRGLADEAVDASASIKGRYRINKNQSLALGTGLTIDQPFHGKMDSTDEARENTSLSSPFLTWSSYYSTGGLQMSSSVDFTYFTTEGSTAAGYEQALTLSQSLLGTVLDNRLTLGVSVSGTAYNVDNSRAQFNTFNEYRAGNNQSALDYATYNESLPNIALGVYPFAEYTLGDNLSLRTVFGYFNYQNSQGNSALETSDPYQSVGIGIAAGRNMYIYPNVQFVPTEVRDDRTNVAVSATINFL